MTTTDTLDGFLTQYMDPQATTYIDFPADETSLGTNIVIRHGRFAVVINPMALIDHLCVDLHSFVDGQAATGGVFGMGAGGRVKLEPTGTTSHKWPSASTIAVLVGEQGKEG
jgi:hypothetical protein